MGLQVVEFIKGNGGEGGIRTHQQPALGLALLVPRYNLFTK